MFETILRKFVGKPVLKVNPSDLEFSYKSKR